MEHGQLLRHTLCSFDNPGRCAVTHCTHWVVHVRGLCTPHQNLAPGGALTTITLMWHISHLQWQQRQQCSPAACRTHVTMNNGSICGQHVACAGDNNNAEGGLLMTTRLRWVTCGIVVDVTCCRVGIRHL